MQVQRFAPAGTSASGTHQTRRGGGVGRYGRPAAFVGLFLFGGIFITFPSARDTDELTQTLGLVFNGRDDLAAISPSDDGASRTSLGRTWRLGTSFPRMARNGPLRSSYQVEAAV
jgi:hypothetical protein